VEDDAYMLTEPSAIVINRSVSDPLSFIGRCAGVSTARSGQNDVRRALSCIRAGHLSVLEHVSVTFMISDVSRSLTHQLVRHRHASFVQLSQRYTKPDLDDVNWYVTPPEIDADPQLRKEFDEAIATSAIVYKRLIAAGIKPEDARFVLPEATKTSIVVTMNLRELQSFYELRTDPHAQWEIRSLAHAMRTSLMDVAEDGDEWQQVVSVLLPEGGESD
jgi:thymidylate synthase (FAD)